MNKILSLFVILSLFAVQDVSAQKIKNERASVAYTRLPSNPLDPSFTTYSAIVYGSDNGLENLGINRQNAAEKYFTLGGFKKVGQGGHFRISVSVGYPYVVSAETKSEKKTRKKDEKTETYYVYKKVITYRAPVRYKVEDYQGNIITSGAQSKETSFDYATNSSSGSVAHKKWRDNRTRLMNDKFKSSVTSKLSSIAGTIKALYAYTPKKATLQVELLGKKDKGTEQYLKACEDAIAAYATMKADEKPDNVRAALRPSIEFWMAEKNKWSANDKKERKVKSACAFNLANAFFWLDDLGEARKYANEVIEIDYKPGRGKTINRSIDALQKLFTANNTTTRHPMFDLSNAVPPSSSAFGGLDAVEEGAPAGGASTKVAGSMIDKNGENIPGEFAVSAAEGEDLKFGPKGNVVFQYAQDGRVATGTLNPAEMQGFTLKDRTFIVADFVPGAKGNTESKVSILEQIYDGGSIKVLKYYPYDDALGDQAVEYAFQKEGEAATSLNSTMFLLFNKGLQKYFSDCSDLAEVAGTGEFKKEEDDIIRAARVYAEMCKQP